MGGHEYMVTSVRFTSDGELLLSGSDDKTVRIWSTSSGQCLRTLRGHQASVCVVTVLGNGGQAASAGTDGTIRVWDVETGVCTQVLGGQLAHVWALDSLDNKRIVSGDFHQTVRIWDIGSPPSSYVKVGQHPSEIRSLAVLPGETEIAVGLIGNEETNEIRVWDIAKADEKPVAAYGGHGDTVSSIAPVRQTKGLVTTGFDKTVRVWGSEPQQEAEKVLEIRSGIVMAAAAWEDGRGFAVGVEDGSLRVWDSKRKLEALNLVERHNGGVACVAVSKDGTKVASGGADKAVRLLQIDEGKKELAEHQLP